MDFFQRFRLPKSTFFVVVQLFQPALQCPEPTVNLYFPIFLPHSDVMSYHNSEPDIFITPEQGLLILLRFLASGNMQITVADVIHVSQSSVCQILPAPAYPHVHTNARDKSGKGGSCRSMVAHWYVFLIQKNKTKIISVRYTTPIWNECYRNRKGFFSFDVQTISSANIKIMNVVARCHNTIHRH